MRTFADQAVIAIENARLLGELQARTRDLEESLEYQTATSDVLNVISRSTFDLQPVLDTLVATAKRLCNADMAIIYRRVGDAYRLAANLGFPPEYEAFARTLSLAPSRASVTQRAALERRISHVADIAADPEYELPEASELGNARTALGVPLLREGEPVGVFTLARQRVEPFSEKEIALVSTFADQAVIAIENARLLTELRESLEQQTATAEVLQVINSSPGELQPVFEAILEKARTHCGATRGTLHLFDGETFRAVAMQRLPAGPGRAAAPRDQRSPGPVLGAAARRGALCPHCRYAPDRQSGGARSRRARCPHQSSIGAAQRRGAARHDLVRPRRGAAILGKRDRVPAKLRGPGGHCDGQCPSARRIAGAHARSRRIARIPDRDQRRAQRHQPLDRRCATGTGHSGRNGRPALRRRYWSDHNTRGRCLPLCVEHSVQRTPSIGRSCASEELSPVATASPGGWRSKAESCISRTSAPTRTIAVPEAVTAGRRSILGVPLLREGTVLGTINLARNRVQPFTERQIDLVRTFADQAVIAMENARLLGELQARTRDLEESLEYQTATSDVLKVISRSASDVQPVLDTVIETAARLCGADSATIFLREGEAYRRVSCLLRQNGTRVLGDPAPANNCPRSRHRRRAGGARRQGRACRGPPRYRGLRAARVCGVRATHEPWGAAAARRRTDRRYRAFPRTGRAVQRAADRAGAHLCRPGGHRDRERAAADRIARIHLEQQQAIAEVLGVINSSPGDLQPVFDVVLEKALKLCQGAFGYLCLVDGQTSRRVAWRNLPAAFVEYFRDHAPTTRPGSQLGRIVAGEAFTHALDLKADEIYRSGSPFRLALVDLGGARTQVLVALRKEDRLLGYIGIYRQEVRAFTDKQIALLQNFAAQAVIAMENARLLGELQARTRDLEESLEYQTATSDVLNVISRSTADVQPVLDTVIETAARLCGADTGSITIREGDVYRWVAGSSAAADPEYWAIMRQRTIVPGRDNIAARVALEGRVVHVTDIRADPDYAQPETAAAGRRTMLGVPLLREGAVLGTISLSAATGRAVHRAADRTGAHLCRPGGHCDRERAAARRIAGPHRTTSKNCSNTRPQRATCSRSSAARPRMCNRCWTQWPKRPSGFAAPTPERSQYARARSTAMWRPPRCCSGRRTIGRPGASEPLSPVATASPGGWRSKAGSCMLRTSSLIRTTCCPRSWRPARTILGVPLLREGAVLGTINLARKRIEPFTERQIELVRTFADQAVIAMENARLLGELQARTRDLEESLEYQTATSDVLNVISRSTADVQPVLDTVAETAARLCSADAAIITIREGEVYRYVASTRRGAADPEFWAILRQRTIVPGRDSVAGRVALEGRVVHVADIRAVPDYACARDCGGRAYAPTLGCRCCARGAVLGTINLARKRVEPFTERQIELVRTFADQAVIAIENARLLGELQARTDELTRSVGELQALEEVLRAVNSSLDLDTVLATIISRAAQLSQADEGTIYEYDETEEVFVPKSAFGMSAERVAALRERRVRLGETHLGRAAVERATGACRRRAAGSSALRPRPRRIAGRHPCGPGGAAVARGQGRRRAGDPPAHGRRLCADHPDACCKPLPGRPCSPSRMRGCFRN